MVKKVFEIEKCQKTPLKHTLNQQQHQQRTTVEEQRSPFFSPTTPGWGDRNVNEQLMEETNNNFAHPSTSDSTFSMNLLSSENSSSSVHNLIENSTNIQSFIDATQLPRKCKLCPYISNDRAEYIDHIISHCTFRKSTYVDVDYSNGYIVDEATEEADDYNLETQEGKGRHKKRPKIPKPKCCNKCSFVAKTKLALWLHLRQHFVQEEYPGFVCTLCPFATTLKHHITFHWFSAHDDFKAYMCKECCYTCVSKSMLTSHMKTHSQVYQYNCGSCKYRTKFCNAMKKHLKDSQHVPGTVLNPDGTPNPFATIDVYGNKRGPRRKQLVEEKTSEVEVKSEEDKPSTSRLYAPVSMVPTSPASSSSISSRGSPSSKMATSLVWKSPIKVSDISTLSASPVSQSHSNSLITDIKTEFNRMSNENEMNPSISSSTNEQISSETLTNPMFVALCRLLFENMEESSKDEERRNAFRLLQFAEKYLVGTGYIEHVASAIGASGYPHDDAKPVDEPSTSTIISGSSTFTAFDESATFVTIDKPSTSTTLVSESQPRMEQNEVLDEPLDLSMSAMSRTENRPQFQESVASSLSKRSKHSKWYVPLTVRKFDMQRPKFHTRQPFVLCSSRNVAENTGWR